MPYVDVSSTTYTCGGKSKSSSYSTKATAKVTVSTSGSVVNWSIKMETSGYPFVYLYVKIAGQVLYEGYYAQNPTNYGSKGYISCGSSTFPRGDGTSKSGTITYDKGTTKPTVDIWVGPSVWYDYSQTEAYNEKNRCYHTTATIDRIYYTAVGTGSTTITDNGNNTFTLTATKGADGTNNTASGPQDLKWGYSNSYGNTFTSGDKKNLEIKTAADATRTVYATSTTKAERGSNTTAATSLAVKQYVAPSKPTNFKLTHSKSRLTIKENWTCSWTAATAANTSSPVKFYRFRVYNGSNTVLLKDSSGTVLTTDAGTGARYYIDTTNTSVTFDPAKSGFLPGDTIYFTVHAFTKDGKGSTTDGNGIALYSGAAREPASGTYTVQNAGIVRVKVNGKWKEGQVLVKINGKWKEAETVLTKINGKWKEST